MRHGAFGRVVRVVIVMVTLAVGPSSVADEPTAEPGDVLVKVGEAAIRQPELESFLHRARRGRPPIDPQQNPVEIAAAVEQLVNERLLRNAIARERVVVDPQAVEAAVEQLRKQIDSGAGARLDTALRQAGSDEATLRRQIEFDLAVTALIAPRVDAASLAAAFDRHRRELDGTRVRVSHIVLRPDLGRGDEALPAAFRKAADIRAAITRGDVTFAEAAARHSVGPSRHRDGDLGLLPRKGEINDAFARAAFALGLGDVSQPVATPFGVHLLTVTAIEPGTATPESLRPQIQQLAAQEAVKQLVAELRRTTPITYSPGVPRLGPVSQAGEALPAPTAAPGPAAAE